MGASGTSSHVKPNDKVRIYQVPAPRLTAIVFGERQGRVLRVYPKLGVVIVEFDEDHIFRLRMDEVTTT